MADHVEGNGTPDDPWILTTPPGKSEFDAWRDESNDPPALMIRVGSTKLSYQLRCIEDLHAMLVEHGDWVALGNADEGKAATPGTVEAWARSEENPVGGWYGLRKGYRAASATTSHPYSNTSVWPRSSTTPATTACGRADRPRCKAQVLPMTSTTAWAAAFVPPFG
jgi:hypothetical protein